MSRQDYDEYGGDWVSRGRRLTRPAAMFGRGRLLSFVMMTGLGVLSFISKNTGWAPRLAGVRPAAANLNFGQDAYLPRPNRLANPPGMRQQSGISSSTTLANAAASNSSVPAIELRGMTANHQRGISYQIVQKHGGAVEDLRTTKIRQVGNRLASAVQNIPPGSLRFYLMRDVVNANAYASSDGSIMMTAAMYGQMRSDGDLAAVLSQKIVDYLYQGVNVAGSPQVADFRFRMLSAAGFDPSVVMQYQARHGTLQIASGSGY